MGGVFLYVILPKAGMRLLFLCLQKQTYPAY